MDIYRRYGSSVEKKKSIDKYDEHIAKIFKEKRTSYKCK